MKISVERTRSLSGRSDTIAFELEDLRWFRHGEMPPRAYTDREKDLMEVARTIHEVERLLPKRIIADRFGTFSITMSLRRPEAWTDNAVEMLTELLRVQGNANWSFNFEKRGPDDATILDQYAPANGAQPEKPKQLVLFSGGLDSTSGLASLAKQSPCTLVMSYFTGNLRQQQNLLSHLGFARHAQIQGRWEHPKKLRAGGSFNYRALLFLALAAAEASAHDVDIVQQFENGPLALAIPPAPIYRVTRHAHPVVTGLAARLFAAVLDRPNLKIQNPFLKLTKGEVADELRGWATSDKKFREMARGTESCWYLKAGGIMGAVKKRTGLPCGVCIPCLVRKAALRDADGEVAVDLTNRADPHFGNVVVRTNVDSYLDMSDRLLDGDYNSDRFLADAPRVTASYLVRPDALLSPSDAFDLYRRFAKEIRKSFPKP